MELHLLPPPVLCVSLCFYLVLSASRAVWSFDQALSRREQSRGKIPAHGVERDPENGLSFSSNLDSLTYKLWLKLQPGFWTGFFFIIINPTSPHNCHLPRFFGYLFGINLSACIWGKECRYHGSCWFLVDWLPVIGIQHEGCPPPPGLRLPTLVPKSPGKVRLLLRQGQRSVIPVFRFSLSSNLQSSTKCPG